MQIKFFQSSRSGVSLLIGIGLVAVILFFSLLVSNVVVSSIRQSANVADATRARVAAEGAMEKALLAAVDNEEGYNEDTETYQCPDGVSYTDPSCIKIRYKIQGQVMGSQAYTSGFSGYYSAPAPGTGNAGLDCDPVEAFYDKDFYYSPTAEPHFADSKLDATYNGPYEAPDHPCNWNKLRVGESVSIPLYVVLSAANEADCNNAATESDGTKVCNPVGLGLSDFKLRVRTPCEPAATGETVPEYCDSSGRYDLYVENYPAGATHIEKDPTVMSWSIEGKSLNGENNYYLGAYDEFDLGIKIREPINSEIFSNRINAASEFVVLSNTDTGQNLEKTLLDAIGFFLLDQSAFSKTGNDILDRPVLKLAVINSLGEQVSLGTTKVPYLEYQLLVNQSFMPPTADKALITAEAFSGEHKATMEVGLPYASGVIDYVVQQ